MGKVARKKSSIAPADLGLKVTARRDGSVEAAYLRLTTDKVARTEEVLPNALLVDLSGNGRVVGMEILAPIPMEKLLRLIPALEGRTAVEKFARAAIPRRLFTRAPKRQTNGMPTTPRAKSAM